MTAPALLLQHLTKRFGKLTVVDDISLEIQGPEVVCLLGPNGAGKSTLMRLITGFLPADAGSVTIAGHSLEQAGLAAREALGYLPENAPVFSALRVNEVLSLFASMHGLSGKNAEDAILEAVQQCQLEPVMNRLTSQLSKGYRHRLGLAQAMLHHPQVLILDEPTDGLDPAQKKSTRALLRKLGEHSTVLVSTHLLDEVPEICNRVLMMAHGRIVYDGEIPADLTATFVQKTC